MDEPDVSSDVEADARFDRPDPGLDPELDLDLDFDLSFDADAATSDEMWPLRYTSDELAALRWLLAQDPAHADVGATSTDPLFDDPSDDELADAIAIGLLDLEETGKVLLEPEHDRITLLPPHDLVLDAARQGAQTLVRRITPDRHDAYGFVISPLLADVEVGLELWRRDDGSVWINTWPLDEMAVRMIELLDLPPSSDPRNETRTTIRLDDTGLEAMVASLNGDDTAPSDGAGLGSLLDTLETYCHLELMLVHDDGIAAADLRVLVNAQGVWLIDADDDADDLDDRDDPGAEADTSEPTADGGDQLGDSPVIVARSVTSVEAVQAVESMYEVL